MHVHLTHAFPLLQKFSHEISFIHFSKKILTFNIISNKYFFGLLKRSFLILFIYHFPIKSHPSNLLNYRASIVHELQGATWRPLMTSMLLINPKPLSLNSIVSINQLSKNYINNTSYRLFSYNL